MFFVAVPINVNQLDEFSQDCFFTRGEYQQLLYQALSGLPGLEIVPPSDDITTLPPAILKPQQRWTGKQVCVCVCVVYILFITAPVVASTCFTRTLQDFFSVRKVMFSSFAMSACRGTSSSFSFRCCAQELTICVRHGLKALTSQHQDGVAVVLIYFQPMVSPCSLLSSLLDIGN